MVDDESRIRVMEAALADPRELSAFLDEAFGFVKERFLAEHGDWWHRGPGGRFVATYDDAIVGYRGMIPTVCFLEGKERPAVWAVDLYVTPRFRGKGLQGVLDQRLLEGTELRMSFPNKSAAKIYVKQGYGLREDLQELGVPLHPRSLHGVRGTSGARGAVLRAGALGLSPLAAAWRYRVLHYRPRRSEIIESPDPRSLEDLFRRHARPDLATTLRSEEHLRWRYLEAPYRSELVFFLAGLRGRPTHCAIVRYMPYEDSVRARILDLFGDLKDEAGLTDLIRTVIRDATLREAVDIRALTSFPVLTRALRANGFLISVPWRFRWLAEMPAVQHGFSTAKVHWTLGDSDNDSPF